MTTKKITKKENFGEIVEILARVDRQDLVEVMQHEIEILDRKKANAKMTKTQTENLAIKELIINELVRLARAVTITELLSESQELVKATGGSNQKVSALMTQLKNENQVVRTQDGKKALFSVAE